MSTYSLRGLIRKATHRTPRKTQQNDSIMIIKLNTTLNSTLDQFAAKTEHCLCCDPLSGAPSFCV